MRKSIKKILSLMIIGTALSILPLAGASAEWRQDSNGSWWYSTGTSWVTGWSQIEGKWYYFDNSGYMKTGWVQDGTTWYYLQQDGSMATNTTTPDGYAVGSNGAWITTNNPISTNTNSTTTLPSTVTDTNTVNTPTISTNSSSSSSSSSGSSSSSSSNKSNKSYMTVYYDDNYNIIGTRTGMVSETIGQTDGNGNTIECKPLSIKLSDYNMTKDEFNQKVYTDYKIVNENGTVKLVPKSTSSNSGSSNNNSSGSNDSEVITTPPETTTGSDVTVTTSSAVSYTV